MLDVGGEAPGRPHVCTQASAQPGCGRAAPPRAHLVYVHTLQGCRQGEWAEGMTRKLLSSPDPQLQPFALLRCGLRPGWHTQDHGRFL